MAPVGEPVVFVRTAAHPAAAGIAPGSGIVGEPRGSRVLICHESASDGQVGAENLADRVRRAHRRISGATPAPAGSVVPREALVLVGTFHPGEGRIILTGPVSERKVAAWLGTELLDPDELRCGGEPVRLRFTRGAARSGSPGRPGSPARARRAD